MNEPLRCDAMGVGVVIDEGEADVLITTGTEDQPVFVVMAPEVAFQIGTTMLMMATEARILQDQIAGLSEEEVKAYLEEIQRRNVRDTN